MTTTSISELTVTRSPDALRCGPATTFKTLLPLPQTPQIGDIALAKTKSIGRLNMPPAVSALCVKATLLAIFGNHYPAKQLEGYGIVSYEN
jgi:hypothetical protein